MGRVEVRGLDETVIMRLDELAAKRGLSRESYLRNVLTSLSISGELFEMDFKYATLVETLADKNQMLVDIIDKNNYVLEEVLENLNGTDNQEEDDDEEEIL